MSETVNLFAFAILSLALLGGAIGMIAAKSIMHSGFCLLGVSVAAAGIYYVLGADYVALVQLLVYAGAVSVLSFFYHDNFAAQRRRTRPRDFFGRSAHCRALWRNELVVIFHWCYRSEPPDAASEFHGFQLRCFPPGWALPLSLPRPF